LVILWRWTIAPARMVGDDRAKDYRDWTEEKHENGNIKDGHLI